MEIKNFKRRIVLALLLWCTIFSASAQKTLIESEIQIFNDTKFQYYFYKGDVISIGANLVEGKNIANYQFRSITNNNSEQFTVMEELPKQTAFNRTYLIDHDGFYSFVFKTKGYMNFPKVRLLLNYKPINESMDEKAFFVVEEKELLYHPDLLVYEGDLYLKAMTNNQYQQHLLDQRKRANDKLRELGIDPEKFDILLPNKIARKGTLMIDTSFEAHSTNKIGATIYADPFYSYYYFRACKGDTIILNISMGRSLQGLNISNYHLKDKGYGQVTNQSEITSLENFAFIAGDDYVYEIEFQNDNVKDVPVKLNITRLSKKDKTYIKRIKYRIIEKTITSENGIMKAKHTRKVPIKD